MAKTYPNQQLGAGELIKNSYGKINTNSNAINADVTELYAQDADFEAQLTQIINETDLDPNKDPEVTNARDSSVFGSFDTVKLRLDNTDDSFTTQLADIAINIEQFGAKPNDPLFDNALPIQNTIDYAYSLGGGNVLIPKGTFYLSSVQGIQSNMITPKPNVNIIGLGRQSILKVKNGMNGVGTKFNVIRHTSDNVVTEINNVIFKDFTIDENGINNLIPSGEFKDNVAIGIWKGKNIIIDNVQVLDNPGRQTFSLGANISPHSVENVIICNCNTSLTSRDVNTFQTDHSTIYLQANNVFVSNNIINSDRFTAIETHSSNANYNNNIIKKCSTAFNIVATVTDNVNSFITKNIIENASRFCIFWSESGFELSNTNINDNVIRISSNSTHSFDISSNVNVDIDKIRIENNTLEYIGAIFTNNANCINIGIVSSLTIKNNQFYNFPSRVISLGSINDSLNLFIEDNKIFDCCKGEIPSYNYPIALLSLNTIKIITIKGNQIENTTSAQFMVKALGGNAPVDDCIITNNNCINLPVDFTYSGVPTNKFYVNHYGNGTPENSLVGSLQSVYYDKITNKKWVKKFQDKLTTGWRSEEYLNAYPITGTYKTNDVVYADSATAGGYIGWICVTSGAPGVWKGFGLIQA